MYNDFRRDMLLDLAEAGIDSQIIGQVISTMDMVATRYTIARATQEIAIRGRDKLEEAAKLYLVCKKIEGCADGTLDNYGRHIKGFVQYCSCPLEEIDANVVRRYLLLYKMGHKVSDRSLDKIRQDLRSWFAWMQNEGYIAKNPMANVAKIKYQVDQKPALTPMELERLRNVCEDDRDRCLVEVLYSTGCRITEALSIKVAEIRFDLPQPECRVIGKGKKPMIVYFSPRAVFTVQQYLATRRHDSEWLFCNDRGGGQMQRENVEKRFRELRELAGLTGKKVTPHTMRHTLGTHASKTVPIQVVQKMLGHSKIDTTMIYVETSQDDVRSYHARAI